MILAKIERRRGLDDYAIVASRYDESGRLVREYEASLKRDIRIEGRVSIRILEIRDDKVVILIEGAEEILGVDGSVVIR